MVVIIVGREFAVSGLRAIASAEGFVLEASELAKTKMVLQVSAITVIVLERHYATLARLHVGVVLLWLVLLFALASAAQYFWSFWTKLDVRVKRRASRPLVTLRVGEKQEQEKDVAAQ
jgi:CDP-diacylglycerol--glycerol-3-phosphate 3-phosphatidyltransferase